MNFQDKIDAYLLGKLSPPDAEVFRQQLLVDSDLEQSVQKRQLVISGLEALGNQQMKKHIQAVRKEILEEKELAPLTPKMSKTSSIRRWLAVAAAIVLLILAWQFFPSTKVNTEQLFAQTYEPYFASFSTREINLPEVLVEAEKQYNNKNYVTAIPLLEQLLKTQPTDSNLQLALGNAYLAIDKTNLAIAQFQTIIERTDPLYTDQAQWYLALSYLKDGNLIESKSLLNTLAKDPNADFHSEAKVLLKRFRN